MNERSNLFSATGIPSLFLIFAVLMLVILSLLGYGTSRQDLQSSTLSLKQTEAYYTVCTEATDFYSEMVQKLQEFQEQSETETEYYDLAADYFHQAESASWDPDTHTVQYLKAFSDTQSLMVKIAVSWYNADTAAGSASKNNTVSDTAFSSSPAQILTWNTVVTADWNPDNSQSVYKGE